MMSELFSRAMSSLLEASELWALFWRPQGCELFSRGLRALFLWPQSSEFSRPLNSLSLFSLDDYDNTPPRCVVPAHRVFWLERIGSQLAPPPAPLLPHRLLLFLLLNLLLVALVLLPLLLLPLSSLAVWRLCCVYRLKFSLKNKKW